MPGVFRSQDRSIHEINTHALAGLWRSLLAVIIRPVPLLSVLVFVIGALSSCPNDWTKYALFTAATTITSVNIIVGFSMQHLPILRAGCEGLVAAASYANTAYCSRTGANLDVRVVMYNVDILFYGPSLRFLLDKAEPVLWALVTVVVLCVILDRALSSCHSQCLRSLGVASDSRLVVPCSILWLMVACVHLSADDARHFIHLNEVVAGTNTEADQHLHSLGINPRADFPLLHPGPVPATVPQARLLDGAHMAALPHVIVLRLESFSGLYFQANCSACKGINTPDVPLTPTLAKFAAGPATAWTNEFYANSIQTIRTTSAMLCGIVPSWRGKECLRSPPPSFRCLPHILGELGYSSAFFQAIDKFSSKKFKCCATQMLGFDSVGGVSAELAAEVGATTNDKLMWGYPDDIIYKAFFSALDRRVANLPPGTPTFSLIETATGHAPFKQAEANMRLYGEKSRVRTRDMRFKEAIHSADRQFGTFLAEVRNRVFVCVGARGSIICALTDSQLALRPWLKHAVVVVTGDHR